MAELTVVSELSLHDHLLDLKKDLDWLENAAEHFLASARQSVKEHVASMKKKLAYVTPEAKTDNVVALVPQPTLRTVHKDPTCAFMFCPNTGNVCKDSGCRSKKLVNITI